MFPPIFPLYVGALAPLHEGAPLVWLSGVVCLWATRYTHQLATRWGSKFYALSAVMRPLGILLIGAGWLALYSPGDEYFYLAVGRVGWLPMGNWMDVLCWAAILLFFAFGAWSVVVLGVRQSFLFRRLDDRLVTAGPYALVRHPQFLAAIGATLFGILMFNPSRFSGFAGGSEGYSLGANWALFTLALWVLSILEDRELAAHFGQEYETYATRVPRLFPN
jgi:protein-S-isoprenylcysteine O-methyltransferase Ste14